MNASDLAASQPASAAAVEAVPATTAASAIPFLRHDEARWGSSGMGAGNALVTVLVVALAAWWLAHRLGWLPRGQGGNGWQRLLGTHGNGLRAVESARLTPKASAHVLQWGGKQVLVVCTEQSATVVAEAPAAGMAPGENAS